MFRAKNQTSRLRFFLSFFVIIPTLKVAKFSWGLLGAVETYTFACRAAVNYLVGLVTVMPNSSAVWAVVDSYTLSGFEAVVWLFDEKHYNQARKKAMSQDTTRKVRDFFSQYPSRTYPKDQILIHAGDDPQYIYFIIRGKTRQYDITSKGDEVVVNIFSTGAYFPMQWALTAMTNRYFFVAETDIEVRAAPPDAAIGFLRDNPDVVLDLLTRVYVGVEGILGRMVRLMSGSAKTRLVYELVIECRRFGEKAEDGSCFITVNESDLAARAGLSRETVSREIRKISKNDLIRVSHGGILIERLSELEEMLESSV